MLYFIQIGLLGLHSLYSHFCVLSFHSILYFSNRKKWNIYNLNNINYNKVNTIISVLQDFTRLIWTGGSLVCVLGVLGISVQGVSVQGVHVWEVYVLDEQTQITAV